MKDLLRAAEILGLLLFIPTILVQTSKESQNASSPEPLTNNPKDNGTTAVQNVSEETFSSGTTIITSLMSKDFQTQTTTTPATTTTTTITTTPSPFAFIYPQNKNFKFTLIVFVPLILVLLILFLSTLALACKVCQLKRRLKTMSCNSSLDSNSKCCLKMENGNKVESQPDAKESCFLLTETGETNQENDNKATEEDGGKVGQEEKKGEEKKAGDPLEEQKAVTPAAPVESSPSKPEEEASSSEGTTAAPPASSSEDTAGPQKEP